MGYEPVGVGGVNVTMPICVTTNLLFGDEGPPTPSNTHSIIGLSFLPGGNFLDFLTPNLTFPWFSTVFRQDNASFIEFGTDINESYYEGELTTLGFSDSSSESQGSWSVHGATFGPGGGP